MHIKIVNWEEYLHRKDMKSLAWFRVNSDIMFHEKLHGLEPQSCWLFIVLLALGAKKMKKELALDDEYLSSISGVEIPKYLFPLIENGLVQDCTDLYVNEANITLHNTTKQNKAFNKLKARSTSTKKLKKHTFEKDLEALYQSYPRKRGKKKGMDRLRSRIKSEDDLRSMRIAFKRFIDEMNTKAGGSEFIPYFSSFMGELVDDYLAEDYSKEDYKSTPDLTYCDRDLTADEIGTLSDEQKTARMKWQNQQYENSNKEQKVTDEFNNAEHEEFNQEFADSITGGLLP